MTVADREAYALDARAFAAQRATITTRAALEEQAKAALISNRAYLKLASPTAAQRNAQADALTRQMNGIIRLLLNDLSGTD